MSKARLHGLEARATQARATGMHLSFGPLVLAQMGQTPAAPVGHLGRMEVSGAGLLGGS